MRAKRTDFAVPETLMERLELRHDRCATATSGKHSSIYLEAADRIKELEATMADSNIKLTPRLWTQEMSKAWHINIPDLHKAFEALRNVKAALKGESNE